MNPKTFYYLSIDMKQPVFLVFICLFVSHSHAQIISSRQKPFLDALNRLVTNTTQHHWQYDKPMQVDSLFHLNGDTLSITWICTFDSSLIRTRLAAPFSKIRSIDWDHYLVLNYQNEKAVQIYEQTNLNPGWRLIERPHLLHVGVVVDKKEMRMKKKIQKAFGQIHH